jgi:hypothetical protein
VLQSIVYTLLRDKSLPWHTAQKGLHFGVFSRCNHAIYRRKEDKLSQRPRSGRPQVGPPEKRQKGDYENAEGSSDNTMTDLWDWEETEFSREDSETDSEYRPSGGSTYKSAKQFTDLLPHVIGSKLKMTASVQPVLADPFALKHHVSGLTGCHTEIRAQVPPTSVSSYFVP